MGKKKDKQPRKRRTNAEIAADKDKAASGSGKLTHLFRPATMSANSTPAASSKDATAPVPPPHPEGGAPVGSDTHSAAPKVSSVLGVVSRVMS